MTTEISQAKILGLKDTENAILNALKFSSLNISEISRLTKIPRTSLLYMLNKLFSRQLIDKNRVGKRTLWKSAEFVFEPSKSKSRSVAIHRGVDQMFKIFEQWTRLPKNARILGIQPDKSIKQSLDKNSIENWLRINESIKRSGIIVEGIVHEKSVQSIITKLGRSNAKKIFDSLIGRLEDYVKIPDEFADVESEVYIQNKIAYIINWNKEIAVEIRDRDMVELLTAMFSCVKEMGTRYSQNEKMRRYKEVLQNRLTRSLVTTS